MQGQSVLRNSWFQLFGITAAVSAALTAYNFSSRQSSFRGSNSNVKPGWEAGSAQKDNSPTSTPFTNSDLVVAAQRGNAQAQLNLGLLYHNGNGVPKDSAEAAKWFQKAAEQGQVDAQRNLGISYANGLGVPKDLAKAARWYEKAAEQGDATAQLGLGLLYYAGDGVPKDLAEATRWYEKAAEQGQVDAQLYLGASYYTGEGVPKNFSEAVKWLQKAAAQGNTNAVHLIEAIGNSSNQTSKPDSNSQSAEDETELFARLLKDWVDSSNAGDLTQQLSLYANPVDFYDEGTLDRDQLLANMQKDQQRWPAQQYAITRVQGIERLNTSQWRVVFDISFEARNGATGRMSTGTAVLNWIVRQIDGDRGLEIASVREQVTSRHISNMAQTQHNGRQNAPRGDQVGRGQTNAPGIEQLILQSLKALKR